MPCSSETYFQLTGEVEIIGLLARYCQSVNGGSRGVVVGVRACHSKVAGSNPTATQKNSIGIRQEGHPELKGSPCQISADHLVCQWQPQITWEKKPREKIVSQLMS